MENEHLPLETLLGIPLHPREPTPEPKPFDPSPEEKAEMTCKADVLAVPAGHPGVTVSRGHAELAPYALKPIFQDNIDLMLFAFAKWAFIAPTQGSARTLEMIKDVMFIHIKAFQTIMDHADGRPIGHASQNGHDIGRMVARRGFQTGLGWLIAAVGNFFLIMQEMAEENLDKMGEADYAVYEEWGASSWMYTQLTDRFFFERARKSLDKEMRKRQAMVDNREVAQGDDQEGSLLTYEDYEQDSDYMQGIFVLAQLKL